MQSDEKFRSLVLDMPVGVLIQSRKAEIVLCNPKALELLGLSYDQLMGKTSFDPDWNVIHEDGSPFPGQSHPVPTVIATGQPVRNVVMGVYRPMTCDRVWLLVDAEPKFNGDGTLGHVVCTFIDITDRKRAEEALRESNELFSLFMKHSPVYAYIKTVTPTESRVLQASENYKQMIGVSGSDMVGKTMEDLFPPDLAASMTVDDWTVVSNREVLKIDEELNGRSYTSIKFPIVKGDATLLAGYTIDITEIKQAEENLKESEERFRALHNASFGGIAIHDNGLILECNQGLSTITGYSIEEIIGMDGMLLLAPGSRNLVKRHIVSGYEKPYEAMGIRKNGEEYPLRLEGRNIPYKGRQVRTVEFRDITEYKHNEAERERLHAQLTQAQKMESVGRLAGGVAHDFNNMLSVILGHVEIAQDELDPSHPLFVHLEEIRKAARRSADITRQLLAFARKQTIAPKVLDLNDTVEGMLTMLRRLIGENISLSWQPGANLWSISMDPSQMDQILANLCVNARDAIQESIGNIAVATGRNTFDEEYCANHPGFVAGEYVWIAVSDTGKGMNKEMLSNIFEPFFTTKGVGEGTGLGLATVYGAVKQNNGFINVYSEPEKGTTFTIYLPRFVLKVDRDGKEKMGSAAPVKPIERGHETILLVEDEPGILKMTSIILEKLGYTVLAANTPGQAMHLAREQAGEIHLLLTDVIMPEMSGRDLAQSLLVLYPDIKRLFMSGYTADIIAHQGILDERVYFIQKPFSTKDLATKVREALMSLSKD
ncbi:MAG: PAS domain S-box protein [Desulfobacteraceae bacterium]|jgi:PAS domain S-box-containing protein